MTVERIGRPRTDPPTETGFYYADVGDGDGIGIVEVYRECGQLFVITAHDDIELDEVVAWFGPVPECYEAPL